MFRDVCFTKSLSTLLKLSLLLSIYFIYAIVTSELAQLTVTADAAMRNKFSRDGNRRDVYVRTRYKQEEGKAKRSFRNESYLRDSMEEGPRKEGTGETMGGRALPLYRPSTLRSAIPHFKGKISVYSGQLLRRGIIRRSSPRG